MKAEELKKPCPICRMMFGPTGLPRHIYVAAYYERKETWRADKKHNNYINQNAKINK